MREIVINNDWHFGPEAVGFIVINTNLGGRKPGFCFLLYHQLGELLYLHDLDSSSVKYRYGVKFYSVSEGWYSMRFLE